MHGTTSPSTPGSAPVLAMEEWFARLAAEGTPLVLAGASGHLGLSADEERCAAQQLDQLLPNLLSKAAAPAEIVLLTGLAPGGDLLFAETASARLNALRRKHRRVGLLPVPVEVLWGDWLTRSRTLARAQIEQMRQRFDRNLSACDTVVRLWPADTIDWSSLPARQLQYQRLSAFLCEQCELLFALLRSGHAGQPGGTSELAAWRENPDQIPRELSSGPRRHRSGWTSADQLVRIDPGGAVPHPEPDHSWAARARDMLREGNYLACYDLVSKAEQQGDATAELRYLQLLALANSGSSIAALRRFEELRTSMPDLNEDWLALEGRLHKDLALRGGKSAQQHFKLASASYEAAFQRTGGYFSAINAATTLMLGGDTRRARSLAQSLLAGLPRFTPRDETDHYYLLATEAEAALLLSDTGRARSALESANQLLPTNINARSRTLQQLARICQHLHIDSGMLEILQLPPVIYLPPGDRGASQFPAREIAAALVYAGITKPPELEAAEHMLACGLRLHVVLAAPKEAMLARWQARHGADWTLRLGRLLDHVQQISTALGFLDDEDEWCDAYVGAMALGLSRLAARRLGCAWRRPGAEGWLDSAPAIPDLRPLAVRVSGQKGLRPLFKRRFAGLIFADFAGFSRLAEADLPVFWANFMRTIAASLAPYSADLLLKHTWGDALHLVTADTRAAAQCACAIQDCLERIRPQLPASLQRLELRLSAHFAPVFSGLDPVEDHATYFGTQLSFTARIEPVTPPGMIFVTEAFAARIALEAPDDFGLDYAGEVKLAKGYGESRLFSLRRATGQQRSQRAAPQ